MTFLEKALEINKSEGKILTKSAIIDYACPSDYELEEVRDCGDFHEDCKCEACWNREMPNTPQFSNPVIEKAYNTGLNDAWELARKLYDMKCTELGKIFGVWDSFYEIIRNCTPQEAIVKLKEYEDAKIIEIGDVVENDKEELKGLVLDFTDNDTCVLVLDEIRCVGKWNICDLKKTSRKVDIKSLLQQIGE